MSVARLQLALFDDKFLVDKNFSFDTITGDNGLEYAFSFADSFEEKEHEVLDLFTFLLKKTYDDPCSYPEFTLEEFAAFKGKHPSKLRRITSDKPEDKKSDNFTNDTERLLYKMLNRKLVFKKEFYANGGKEKKERFKSLEIIDQYERTTDLKDSRRKVYRARLQKNIRNNLANFVFLLSQNDYQLVIHDYYRNPNLRSLYLRLGNIFNILKNGQKDQTHFNDICFILGYDPDNTKESKRMITEAIMKLLPLESLKGLGFEWKPTKNGYRYVPHFFLTQETHDNLYNEKTIDKYKRLDTSVMTAISDDIMFSQNFPFIEKEDLSKKLNEIGGVRMLGDCFEKIFKKEASMNDIDIFMTRFCYVDDFKNVYGSTLLKHVLHEGQPIIKTEFYNGVKFVFS